jgi:hypothetical protein
MECPVDVLFKSASEWKSATLVMEYDASGRGRPIIELGDDEIYEAGDIQNARVPFECPNDLFNAATKAGFHLIRKKPLAKTG